MDPLVESLVKTLLRLTSQAKKMVYTSGALTIESILKNTTYNPRVLLLFINSTNDKNTNVRGYAVGFLKVILEAMTTSPELRNQLERSNGLDLVEKCVSKTLQDANSAVRQTSREIFDLIKQHWPNRAQRYFRCPSASFTIC
jgi:CLIP-associating protein 1/2